MAKTNAFHQLLNRALGMGPKFSGVYQSMEEATKAAPPKRRIGYHNEEAAGIYRDHCELRRDDYTVVYWPVRMLRPQRRPR